MTYIWNEYRPNPYLLIISLILFTLVISRQKGVLDMGLIGLAFISMGWAFSFSKKNETIKEDIILDIPKPKRKRKKNPAPANQSAQDIIDEVIAEDEGKTIPNREQSNLT